jgi:multiple sugar transport system ATP-binding protein
MTTIETKNQTTTPSLSVPSSSNASALHIKAVNKRFGTGSKSVEVLQKIDIDVAAGEFLILVGPSGCGKSTLLNIIAGLEQPTGGEILLGGRNIVHLPPKDRDIAMVFQSYALYPTMSVADNIGFALEMRGMPKAERQKRIQEVAAMLQMQHLLERKPGQLSGGQRQRVAMGRALARHPKLFLFDEPLSNLDAKLRVEMRAEIKRLHQQSGITSVYVTHDQIEAMTLGSRIAIMNKGILQQLGTPNEVYRSPANLFVATFIGSPTINLIDGALRQGVFFAKDQALPLSITCPAQEGQACVLGLRPEDIRLDADSAWQGTIQIIEPTGADTYLLVQTPQALVNVRVSATSCAQLGLATGNQVGLNVDTSRIHWFDKATEKRISTI